MPVSDPDDSGARFPSGVPGNASQQALRGRLLCFSDTVVLAAGTAIAPLGFLLSMAVN